MILAFADLHFGLRSYSHQLSSGFFNAEEDAIIVLEKILERASQPDIEIIIMCGDITHTNKPTSLIIKYLTNWFHRINDLGKAFFIIPGNHDDSVYSHSTAFISELKLKNIFIFDKAFNYIPGRHTVVDIPEVKWNDWTIVFAPYSTLGNTSLKNKDDLTHSLVKDCISLAQKKTIIVAHVHESSCKLGSEQVMISKGVDIVNLDIYNKEDVILLTGHIHRFQIYRKGNIVVCYPGSPYYMDVTDTDQQKGYVLINKEGEITFEAIQGIRKFQHFKVPENVDPVQFLKSMRILKNQVMFFTLPPSSKVYEQQLKEYILTTGNYIGKIYYKSQEFEIRKNIILSKNDPYAIIKDNINIIFNKNTDYTNFGFTKEEAEEKLFQLMSTTYQNTKKGESENA